MADESTAQEGVENETALPEGKVEDQAVTEADEADETEGEDQEPEFDEYDFGGNKLKLPKGSVPDELRDQVEKFSKGTWSDYTRKSQEVAEARKAIEAERSAVDNITQLNADAIGIIAQGRHLNQEVAQLQQIDLDALWQSNPDQARRVSDLLRQKNDQYQRISSQLQEKLGTLHQTQQADLERRKDAGRQVVAREIKDFETKALPGVIEYATKHMGMTKEQAVNDWPLHPAMAIAVYEASLYRKMQASAAKAAKPQLTAPEQPVTPMKGKGTATRSLDLVKDADRMSADEWMKRRIAQVTKRA